MWAQKILALLKWAPKKSQPFPQIYQPFPPIVNDHSLTLVVRWDVRSPFANTMQIYNLVITDMIEKYDFCSSVVLSKTVVETGFSCTYW